MSLGMNGFGSCRLTTSCMMINPIHKSHLRKKGKPGITKLYYEQKFEKTNCESFQVVK